MTTATALTGIGLLATQDDELGEISDAAVVIDGEQIVWVGPAARVPDADDRLDLGGRAVIPGFVDSHAHLVFAGDRAAEFAARMAGTPYAAGGIRTTVAATRAASDGNLRANLARLAGELLRAGVTTFECKSGYGLDVATEERSLRLAREFTDETTYLGAHVVPPDTDRADYLALLIGPMLAACAPHARWVDVFCERGAFDADETRAVLAAGIGAGLGARVHANQLEHGAGVQLAVELGAASADHCTTSTRTTSTRWPAPTQSPRCCRSPSSRPARPTRTRGGCSTRACRRRWRPTATPARRTRRRCRSRSRSLCARWA